MNLSENPAEVEFLATASNEFRTLVKLIQKLRGPDGCPWDKEQTQTSLAQFAIEEAFELVEALESGKQQEICEELGDFLFQVILHAQVARDQSSFDLIDVLKRLNQKMIHRHPHVFGDVGPRSLDEVWLHWDQLKAKEKAESKPVFSYPRAMPALQASHKIGVKSEGYRFDWDTPEQVLQKLDEEIGELKLAMKDKDPTALQHELGDVLFSVAQLARHLGLEAEQCLRAGNRRFEDRFNYVLKISGLNKEEFRQLPQADKEKLWQQAKKVLDQ